MKTLAFFFIVLMIVSAGFVLALDAQTIITGGGNSQTTLEYFGNNELFFMGKSSSASPNTPSPFLLSVDGTNKTTADLNCSSLISDLNGNNLNVSVEWFKNGFLNLSLDYNNSYANATLFSAILNSGNTTKNDNWSCSLRIYNGAFWSDWGSSNNLTVLNSLPTVTLILPSDWNSTTNRTPLFSWVGNDSDGDNLTYDFNLTEHQFSGFDSCSDIRLKSGLANESYIPTTDLLCLYDNGFYYDWSVRANDGTGYGNWSTIHHINITAEVLISLNSTNMIFGQLAPDATNDTTDNSPEPFIINNDGNVVVNISLNSSALWDTQPDNSTYYQFKANNVTGEEGAFDWLGSITDWFNMPISADVVAIDKLNYTTGNDSAKVDIKLQVPANEAPGSKSALTIFSARLAE